MRHWQFTGTDPIALHQSGLAFYKNGQYEEAISQIEAAISIAPGYVEAISDLVAIYRAAGQPKAAVELATRLTRLAPAFAPGHCNLGAAHQDLGQHEAALSAFREALRINPQFLEAQANAVDSLITLKRHSEAIGVCVAMVKAHPTVARSHFCSGNVLRELDHIDDALASFKRAVAIDPGFAEAHINIGSLYLRREAVNEAIDAFTEAVLYKPSMAIAHHNLGSAYQLAKRHAESINAFANAARLDPANVATASQLNHQRRVVCDWSDAEAERHLLRKVTTTFKPIPPFPFLSIGASAAEQQHVARLWSSGFNEEPVFGFDERRIFKRGQKLKIGYLSADFREHPTAYLTADLFCQHDRNAFAVIGYSIGRDDRSAARASLSASFDQFVDLNGVGDRAAAERVHADQIDILVDLNGYAQGARTQILAHRPAPIQVNYLGYPGTMGCDFIDYLIADPVVVPVDQQWNYDEKIVQLPDCYQPNTRCGDEPFALAPTRAACSLPDDAFVFCSFNNSFKITPDIFSGWMRILAAVQGSVLWLIDDNPIAKANLAKEAAARHIDPARLVFAPRTSRAHHLARHSLADLFLDCAPYNAHTTASDALRTGLPIVTVIGDTFAARVTASLLHTIGAPELIADSIEDYEMKAILLATSRAALGGVRTKIRTNRFTSPLYDIERYTRHLEDAYRRMWQIWSGGSAPEPITIARR